MRHATILGAIASTLTMIGVPAQAQTAAPTTAPTVATSVSCPASFAADALAGLAKMPGTPLTSSSNVISSAAFSLIPLRYQYDDLTPPPGCDATRTTLVKTIGLNEDLLLVSLALQTDAANASTYADFLSKNFQPRLNKLNGLPAMAVTAAATTAVTVPTVTSSAVSASTDTTCTDKQIQGQVSADVGGFPDLSKATVSGLANAALTVIKIRYTYEDETAPSGCAAALSDGRQFMALSEDTLLLNLLSRANPADEKQYEDFRVANVVPRVQVLANRFNIDIGFATPSSSTATRTP